MARLSIPRVPAGCDPFKAVGTDWTLYRLPQDGRFKLVANQPVEGHANYTLEIVNGKIKSLGDGPRLRKRGGMLFEDVERAMEGVETVAEERDPYGDLLVARHDCRFSPEQKWERNRVLIRISYIESCLFQGGPPPRALLLENIATYYEPLFESSVPTKILEDAVQFATKGVIPPADVFVQLMRDYHDGKFRPRSMATLVTHLDILQEVF